MHNTFVLSHAACHDGLAAAYAAWRRFGDRARYRFLSYHDPLPQMPDGADIYIVDYWRSPDELLGLLARGCEVVVLDHHETAMIDALRMIGKLRDRKDLFVQASADYVAFNQQESWRSLNLWSDDDLCTINFHLWEQERLEDFVLLLKLRSLQIQLFDDDLLIGLNMDRSGAAIAWEHFHNDEMPDLIRYIEDRDLWRWELPDSEAVSEALGLWISDFRRNRREAALQAIARQLHKKSPDEPIFIGFDPSDAASLMSSNLRQICEIELATHQDRQAEAIAEFLSLENLVNLPDFVETMAERGKPLVQPRRDAVAEMCREVHWCEILGYRVPVVRAERYHSWVGHELCRLHPEAPFSMTYRDGDEGVILVDLRSSNGFRVNRIARKLGGGGHAPAAGFTIQQIRTLSEGDVAPQGSRHRFINVALMDGRPWIIESIMMLNDAEQWELMPPQIWELCSDGRAEEVSDRDNVVQVNPNAWIVKLKEDG